jgi:hypothetical protein
MHKRSSEKSQKLSQDEQALWVFRNILYISKFESTVTLWNVLNWRKQESDRILNGISLVIYLNMNCLIGNLFKLVTENLALHLDPRWVASCCTETPYTSHMEGTLRKATSKVKVTFTTNPIRNCVPCWVRLLEDLLCNFRKGVVIFELN